MNWKMYDELAGYCNTHRVTLVAVSKTRSATEILRVYESGQKIFGENKVQEMMSKQPLLPNDIQWHLIGHLQTNKVKAVVPFVYMIQSVDSLRLLTEINSQSQKINRTIPVLLQVHIAREETKFGLSYEETEELMRSKAASEMKNVLIHGLMGMATLTEDQNLIRTEFRSLKNFFDRCNRDGSELQVLSMGMSSDYKIAVEEGSTMVRIGSVIFGERAG